MRLTRPTQRRRSAAAAVELAIILPVLAVLVIGCLDFGRFAYSYIGLTNAARAGAFYAAMNPYSGSTQQATWLAGIRSAARQEMTNQTGYSTSDLTIDQTALTASNNNTVFSNNDVVVTIESNGERRVKVTAHLTFKTIILYPGLSSTVNMQRACEMRSIR